MTNYYEDIQKKLIKEMIATQSVTDSDPFLISAKRKEAFEGFLFGSDGLTSCGCGDPESTLKAFLIALDVCVLEDHNERKALLQEKFGVEYVSENGLVQLLFYILNDKFFLEHGGSVNYSWLTDAGKILRVILREYLDRLSAEQHLDRDLGLDF